MNVYFYSFTKRKNSTLQPSGTLPSPSDCKLKDNCSIHDPVLICQSNLATWNYAYIPTWGRYYFITDTVYLANNLVEYHMTEDVLASNKIAIGNTVANIAYASDHYNSFIVDPRIKVSTSKYLQKFRASDGHGHYAIFNEGIYLLTIYDSANVPSAYGMATCYIMSSAIMQQFKNWMSSDTIMDALHDYFGGDPMQAIFSIKWIPYTEFASSTNDVTGFVIGTTLVFSATVSSGNTFKRLNDYGILVSTYEISHSFRYNDFRRCEPYTTGLLYLPGVGCLPLNPSDFVSSDKIYIEVIREDLTGDVSYIIKTQTGEVIQTAACNVATTIPYGRITTDVQGMANSVGGLAAGVGATLVGAVTGNIGLILGGAGAALASSANMALSNNKHGTSIVSGAGSRSLVAYPYIEYTEIALDTEDPTDANYIATFGRPVAETHKIETHSGFVQTIDAHVSLNASNVEMEEVDNLLNSGIYYE